MNLAERYRPADWSEVVGQDKAIREVRQVMAKSWGGRAYFIVGKSGTGKNTLADIIAREGADPFNIENVNARKVTPATVADIERSMHYRGMGSKPGKAWIIDEVHGLRRDVVGLFLTLLDPGPIPEHCLFLFLTTKEGKADLFEEKGIDVHPFISRCTEVVLSAGERTRQAFARRAYQVAKAEGLDGVDLAHYERAADECGGNMRQLLSRVESGQIAAAAKVKEKKAQKAGGIF